MCAQDSPTGLEPNMFTREEFLASIYSETDIGDGIYSVLDHMNQLLLAGQFSEVDELTGEVDLEKLDCNVGFSFLTMTMTARLNKEIRVLFVGRLIERMMQQGYTREYAQDLLGRYR